MSDKEADLEFVRQLPDEMSVDDIIEHLTILASLRRAEEEIDAGRGVPHDEVKYRIASWFSR